MKDVIILEIRQKLLSKEHKLFPTLKKPLLLTNNLSRKKVGIHKLTKAPIKLNVVEQLKHILPTSSKLISKQVGGQLSV